MGERFRLIRLVICGSVFVLLVAAKLLLPGKMADFNRKLSETMSRNIDVQAVFSAVGDLFTGGGTPSVTADEVYQAVFHPEAAAQKTVASTGGSTALSLSELQKWRNIPEETNPLPAGDEDAAQEETAMDLVLYSDEDLPENVSMRQAILGFDHETPVKGALSSCFGYREHPVEGGGAVSLRRGSGRGYRHGHCLLCGRDGDGGRGEQQLWKILHRHHANGCTTLYAHCSRISVTSGTAVKEGEKLGRWERRAWPPGRTFILNCKKTGCT